MVEERAEPVIGASQLVELPTAVIPSRQRIPIRSNLAGDVERAAEFRNLHHKINGFQNLPSNWDGYGSGPLSAIGSAFLHGFLNESEQFLWLPAPQVKPIDGGALVTWQVDASLSAYVEISDAATAYRIQRNRREIGGGAGSGYCVDIARDALQELHGAWVDG